jgi:Skp family chaperone for outer membrane proteins
MRLRATLRWIAIASLVLGAAGSATAQPAAPAAAGTDAQVGFERRPQLSPQEELTQADTILARVDGAAATVRRQLETARQARDVVKTLCLNDKLSQIDVANRSARDRQSALQAAAQRNDAELSNHEFAIMTVLRQRVEQLTAEANQCIGEEMAFIGQTSISTTIDPNLPGEDNTANPATDPTPVTEPPACSSMCVP